MGRYSRKKKNHGGKIAVLLLTAALLAVLAGALVHFLPQVQMNAANENEPAQTAPTDAAHTQTVPAAPESDFQPAANGKTGSVQCRASYTGAASDGAQVVATAGSASLTAGELQILYLSQVNAQRSAAEKPDYSRPLDIQRCPLAQELSWQQYFLQRAVLSWQARQAVLNAAAQPQRIEEEAYQPNYPDKDIHGKYISPDLPVNGFLYQNQDCYTPNSIHQAYLDSLEETLNTLAQASGYGSLDDMAKSSTGTTAAQWVQAAADYNMAYMYFTEVSYGIDPTDAEVSDYVRSPDAVLSDGGEETVNIRQALFVPRGGTVAADGTVTATQAQWDEALARAEAFREDWGKLCSPTARYDQNREAGFAQLASQQSDDNGSKIDGGFYGGIRKGQLIAPLDEWCFANGRQQMDAEIIKSDLGYHVVLLTAFGETGTDQARDSLEYSLQQKRWSSWLEQVPLHADYSKVTLWADTTAAAPTLEAALYPDVAHQRFPEVMVYLQQDYYYYPFGDRYVGPNGCGITTFAMLATYMTDSLQTPAMMSKRFDDDYFDVTTHATDGSIFSYAPAEMGFYADKMLFELDDVIPEVQSGKLVISLQQKGHFTSSGHYLIITQYNAADDTFRIRDSNIFNYGRLSGHKVDWFQRYTLLSGGGNYYVMQPKVTAIPACARCGGSFDRRQPAALLREDYTCEKCVRALSRRNHFLSLLDDFS